MKNKLHKLTNKQTWAKWLFWSWNIIFLAFMFLGFAPTVLPEMITAVRSGEIPTNFLVYAAILTLIPAITIVVGYTWLRRSPGKLFALGYGVEGPLMLILAVRFFIIRQSTPAIALILISAGLGILTFLWQLLDNKIDQRGPAAIHLRFVGQTLLLIVGVYASLWLTFYVIPLVAQSGQILGDGLQQLWQSLINLEWQSIEWRWVPFFILYIPLLLFTGALFVMMPVTVSILYIRTWLQSGLTLAARYHRSRTAALATAVLLTLTLLLIQTDKQPQHKAFALLDMPPANISEAESLLAQEETIRSGLLNAYLAPKRYVSAAGEMGHIRWIYEDTFDISTQKALEVQQIYEAIARPILYQPVNPVPDNGSRWQNQVFINEPVEAAELYEQFFDEPIIDGERETIVRAVRSTWMVDQARAGWQAVDDREILLTHQEINVSEQGDWAEVELYEVYQNQTTQRQEVVYYFSLPETAVITGVWLGNNENRDERFEFRIAPRGAAQQMYQEQVQRRIDPALVEQIGPSQYRLRAFPIEPQRRVWNNTGVRTSNLEDSPPLHLWLTYQVLADGDAWPLPYLAEKRNVYWNDDTVRLINGGAMEADESTWLPTAVPATTAITPAAHQVDFPNGQTVLIQPETAVSPFALPDDLKLAIVLDRSRSMAELAEQTEAALTQLAATGTADLYLTASEFRGESPTRTTLADFDPAGILYYGGQNAADLLVQFADLQQGEAYDAIFVLTDGTGYGLSEGDVTVPVPDAPVWMVHVDGRFPIGYDDATLQAIQASGGGTAGSVDEALIRLLAVNGGVVNGYAFTVLPTDQVDGDFVAHAPSDDFAALAARQFILDQMAQNRATITDLATLDALHALAIEHSIVTPYSSMIVLVTEQQQRRLDTLEEGDDRFEREFEDVGETNQLTVTGVPEPEEWLLIGLTAAMLGWFVYTSRQNSPRKRLI
jgi:putative PEP-CTERM system integral membrane protein